MSRVSTRAGSLRTGWTGSSARVRASRERAFGIRADVETHPLCLQRLCRAKGSPRALSASFASSRLRLRNAVSLISDSPSYPSPPCTACSGGHRAPQLVWGMTADASCALRREKRFTLALRHPRAPSRRWALCTSRARSARGPRASKVRRARPRLPRLSRRVGECATPRPVPVGG